MSRIVNRRAAFFGVIGVVALVGAAWAQEFSPDTPPLEFHRLKLKITLSDGQTVDLHCMSVNIEFPSGSLLHVTNAGALPLSTPTPTPPGLEANSPASRADAVREEIADRLREATPGPVEEVLQSPFRQ